MGNVANANEEDLFDRRRKERLTDARKILYNTAVMTNYKARICGGVTFRRVAGIQGENRRRHKENTEK